MINSNKQQTEINEKTTIRLTVSALVLILGSLFSLILSGSLYMFTLQESARNRDVQISRRVTLEQYEKDQIRDSVNAQTNKKILKKIQKDVIQIKKKIGVISDEKGDLE